MTGKQAAKVIVGIDGTAASAEALRQAAKIGTFIGATVEAWICWDFPAGYEAYLPARIAGFAHVEEKAHAHCPDLVVHAPEKDQREHTGHDMTPRAYGSSRLLDRVG